MSKKGFTLIELLAVILVLGIISLIAIPTINTILKNSNEHSLMVSVNTLANVSEQKCQFQKIKGDDITSKYIIADSKLSSPLNVKNLPDTGIINVDNDCNANVTAIKGDYCAIKVGDKTTISKNLENCNSESGEINKTEESCFIFDENSKTITGYDFNNPSCSSEVSIPATINNVPVEHINDFAFVNVEYDSILSSSYDIDVIDQAGMEGLELYGYKADILENESKFSDYNLSLIELVKIKNTDLKKKCYYNNGNYDEVPYNYVVKDSDSYFVCNLTYDDSDVDWPKSESLTKLDLSKATNLISIGNGAFYGQSIESINFGNLPKLTDLGISSFTYNEISGTVDLSGLTNIEQVPNGIFDNNLITNVIFPSNITEIGTDAFSYNNITSLSLPNTIINIGAYAFQENLLTSITIPDNIINIAESVFKYNNITSINFGKNNKYIQYEAFMGNQLTNIIVPDSIKVIYEKSFSSNLLTNVTLPNNLIYLSGFDNNNITSINIPNTVTYISSLAFNKNLLTKVIIPDSVFYISDYAFSNNSLTSLSLGKNIILMNNYVFANNNGIIDSVVIPNNLTSIPDYAFNKSKINSITIGDNITSIGKYAFYGSNATTLNWGKLNKLKTISLAAFRYLNVTRLDIPSGVTSIGGGTFQYLAKALIVNIPDSVTKIDYSAFIGVNPSATVNIGSGITSIGVSCFGCYDNSCSNLTININRAPNTVSGSPWDNKYGIINWTGTK